jgi:AraC-like DNA-binding protein
MLLFTAQIVAILSVLLLAVGYLKADFRASSARVFALIALCVALYLMSGMTGPNIAAEYRLDFGRWQPLIGVTSSSISGLFMFYCFLIFQEARRFPLVLAGAFLTQVCAEFTLMILASQTGIQGAGLLSNIALVLDLMQRGFVVLAIYWTLSGWRADLVEDRRVFRWFVIGVQGALIFFVLFLENFVFDGGTQAFVRVQAITVYSIAALALGMLLVSMKFDYVSLSQAIRKVTEREVLPAESAKASFDIAGFNVAFREGYLYREAGLTIAVLATKLGLPEYKLRAFIHQELGFRNFNAMLHVYRVAEASEILADPKKVSLPVLTIALSVGYQSITPFNNAFRELKGMTPSEFRKQALD